MKKIFALVFIAAAAASAFAEEAVNVYFDVDRLISDGLFENRTAIREAAPFLTPVQKSVLYKEHKKDAVVPFLANWLVGFGVGSFIQGDVTGGMTVIVSGGVATGLILYAVSPLFELANTPADSENEQRVQALNARMEQNLPVLFAGYGLFLAGGIYSLIRPWTYAESWNETLRSALNPAQNAEISFVPLSDGQSLGCGIRIEL